jgi:hypothetical protein
MSKMHATRGELEFGLDDLEERLPKLVRDHRSHIEFWAVFHAYADPLVEDATYEDLPFVRQRIEAMLEPHGLTIEWS